MTHFEALHNFFSGFGLTAYPQNAVPYDTAFPYLTYEKKTGSSVEISVHIYYYTESEKLPSQKVEDICASLRNGGKQILYDGGSVWVKLSNPESIDASYNDSNSEIIKHKVINMTLDYTML